MLLVLHQVTLPSQVPKTAAYNFQDQKKAIHNYFSELLLSKMHMIQMVMLKLIHMIQVLMEMHFMIDMQLLG
jgi:hypothetical protein